MSVRELLPPGGERKKRHPDQIAAATPLGLDYPATKVGVTGNITVSYDSALGAPGLALAQQFLNAAEGPYNDMQTFFGIAGGTVQVIIAPLSGHNDGSGGAYHYGCDFTSGGVLYLDATFASTTVNPLNLEIALYVAELSESFMGPQGGGWGCGFSNGEGLSRFCAEQETPAGTLNAFVTGPSWAQAGFPDWVSKTENTDRDAVSTGCAIVYIYWMRSLGYTIPQIVQAAGTTLAANYQKLTGRTTAYADLKAALNGLTVNSDNPFHQVIRTQGNFDGDLKTDFAVWRPSNGTWFAINSSSGTQRTQQWGVFGDYPTPGDFDGDGKTDFAVWRPGSGTWFVIYSSNGVQHTQQWGTAGDIPVPGDYDGDGKTDFAVWRPSSGTWFVIYSSTGAQHTQQWGVAGDVPVPADYDGDGKTDFAVWRPSDGTWYAINSSNGAQNVRQWGVTGDVPAPGDYDGDGKADFAVWRPGSGTWFVINSSNGTQRVQQWGTAGDIPVPGDYDGDGKTDFAVWRPGSGDWFVIYSSNGTQHTQQWGVAGDVPA